MKRLLVYSQDGMGLGHLRRTRSIALEVLHWQPDTSVLTLADSPATPFFPPVTGMDYVKLPTVVKTGDKSWRPGTLPMETEQVVRLRSRLILETFLQFRPDAVLVDHMPVGTLGELKPMLDVRGPKTSFYLGLRDVLGAPEVICDAWQEVGAYEYLDRYDALMIYGCQDVYPVEDLYRLTPHASRLTYCHYVAPDTKPAPLVQDDEEPFIVLTGGGGKDSFRLAGTFLDAVPLLRKRLSCRGLILTGPNMSHDEREQLRQRASSCPVDVMATSNDATAWVRRASLVVTMAGYNSLSEVLALRKKALVVPRAGPSREQRIRSRVFSDLGLIRTLDPDQLSAEKMADALLDLHSTAGVPDSARMPQLDGATQAARIVMGEGHQRTVRPAPQYRSSELRRPL